MGPPCLCRNPIQCIVPPPMIEAIKMRGTPSQVRMAEGLEQESSDFRDQRQARAPATAFRAAPTVAPGTAARPQHEVYDC
jgi:hypothetical protein